MRNPSICSTQRADDPKVRRRYNADGESAGAVHRLCGPWNRPLHGGLAACAAARRGAGHVFSARAWDWEAHSAASTISETLRLLLRCCAVTFLKSLALSTFTRNGIPRLIQLCTRRAPCGILNPRRLATAVAPPMISMSSASFMGDITHYVDRKSKQKHQYVASPSCNKTTYAGK